MSRPLLLVSLLGALLLSSLGIFWLQLPPTGGELTTSLGAALDYAEGWKSIGGPVWWTPNFFHGTSTAPLAGDAVSTAWLLLWSGLPGLLSGAKLGGFLCLFLGALGVYAWVQRLSRDRRVAIAGAVAFLLAPAPYVWLGFAENWPVTCALAVLPLVLWSVTVFVETPSRLHGLFFGAALALLALTSPDASAALLPLLAIYAGVWWKRRQDTWSVPTGPLLLAFAVFLLLGIVPHLPAIREVGLTSASTLAPMENWGKAFSLKSNILWFDRDAILSAGMPPFFAPGAAQGGNYLGLIPAGLLIAVLGLRPKRLYSSDLGWLCRIFIGLALVGHWLSFGPRSILGGHLEFLRYAWPVADPVIALSWFLLLAQCWILFRLLPPDLRHRRWIGAGLSLIYLLVPGFFFLAWLPFYSHWRTPQDFSEIGGVFFFVVATAAALFLLAELLPGRFPKKAAAVALVLLALLDISPYFRPFLKHPADKTTFADFTKAANFLAHAPRQGEVLSISGRSYDLLLPHLAQRGTTSSSLDSYFMNDGIQYLRATADLAHDLQRSYLNISGVAYVLIDKREPAASDDVIQRFKALLRPALENDHFLVLENPDSLAPAYVAQSFISGDAPPNRLAYAALALERLGVTVLPEIPETSAAQTAHVGQLTKDGYKLEEGVSKETTQPFQPISLMVPRWKNYQQFILAPTPVPGWIVIPEAFHRDWSAFSDVSPLPLLEDDGAFLAVPNRPAHPIAVTFSPPLWYNLCLLLPALAWVAVGGLLVAGSSSRGPRRLGGWLRFDPLAPSAPPPLAALARPPIKKAVVLIPTYNEASNLPKILDKIFAADPRVEVLIIDDNSPDGTQEAVKTHPAFGLRLHLLPRPGKMGLGSAYKDGFQWAFQRSYDACLEMDADLSHNPADIPRLLEALDRGMDAAIGSRYLGGVRVMNWPVHRLWLSTGASRYVALVTKLPLTDATSGFKALRTSALKLLNWQLFRAEGYGFQVELHYFLWRAGAKLEEIPIIFTERRDGETKMTLQIAAEAAWRTACLPYVRRTPPEDS